MCFRCQCCDRMWYSNGVKKISEIHESVQHCFENIQNEYTVCYTCNRSLLQGKIPELARINGFYYLIKPDSPLLNKIEERLVSPRLPFLQIRKLGADGQFGLKGNIINDPLMSIKQFEVYREIWIMVAQSINI